MSAGVSGRPPTSSDRRDNHQRRRADELDRQCTALTLQLSEKESELLRVRSELADVKYKREREKEEHELTHIPYRSWCEQCIKGRG